MRRIVTLDIETLPAPEPDDILELSGKKLDEYVKTSLNGDFGRIICIGFTREDDRGTSRKACSVGTKSVSDFHAMRQRC